MSRRKKHAASYTLRFVLTDVGFNVLATKQKAGLSYNVALERFLELIVNYAQMGFKNQALSLHSRSMYNPVSGNRVYIQFVAPAEGETFRPTPVGVGTP